MSGGWINYYLLQKGVVILVIITLEQIKIYLAETSDIRGGLNRVHNCFIIPKKQIHFFKSLMRIFTWWVFSMFISFSNWSSRFNSTLAKGTFFIFSLKSFAFIYTAQLVSLLTAMQGFPRTGLYGVVIWK